MIRVEVVGETAADVILQLRDLLEVMDGPKFRQVGVKTPRRFAHALSDATVLAAVSRIAELGVGGAAATVGRKQAFLSSVVHGRAYRDLQPQIRAILEDARKADVAAALGGTP